MGDVQPRVMNFSLVWSDYSYIPYLNSAWHVTSVYMSDVTYLLRSENGTPSRR